MPLSKINVRNTRWEKDVSGLDVLHADEPHALLTAAGYLKFRRAETDSEGIFFRGQRKLYGSLEPTLFRNTKSIKAREKKSKVLNGVVRDFGNAGAIFKSFKPYAYEPLLQHYGITTTWLDLVDNVWVALWFACHQAKSAGKSGEYLHFERRIPSKNDTFAYILLVAADITKRSRLKPGFFHGPSTELIDLRMAAPSLFLRPHAQHGLLFRMKGAPGHGRPSDYSGQVKGVIRVDLSKAIHWLGDGSMVGVHSLFPPPFYDDGYRILLSHQIDPNLGIGNIAHVGA